MWGLMTECKSFLVQASSHYCNSEKLVWISECCFIINVASFLRGFALFIYYIVFASFIVSGNFFWSFLYLLRLQNTSWWRFQKKKKNIILRLLYWKQLWHQRATCQGSIKTALKKKCFKGFVTPFLFKYCSTVAIYGRPVLSPQRSR